jgi:endo-1,4-beta-mannosidase
VRWRLPAAGAGLCGLLAFSLWINAQLTRPDAGSPRNKQLAAAVAGLRVMNYYPAADGWNKMWTNWQPSVIGRDFAQIRALGANAVRIIVFPATFGWPAVSPVMATRFADVLATAAAHDLGVQLTLFDRWASYGEVRQSQVWLHSLLKPYSSDPEIHLVELKNEVDPSDPQEVAWLRALLPSLRSAMPGTPITVSVTGAKAPSEFVQLKNELAGAPLDIADMHFYGKEKSAYSWMRQAKQAAAEQLGKGRRRQRQRPDRA